MNNLESEIEAYLNGEMTVDERILFEEKVQNNPDVASEFQLYKEMRAIYDENDWELAKKRSTNDKVIEYERFLKSNEGKSLADSIKNAEKDYFIEKPKSGFKRIYLYAGSVAAAVVLAILIYTQINKPVDTKSLYASNKNWDDLPSLTLRDKNTTLASAEKLFRQKEDKEAIQLFQAYDSGKDRTVDPQVLLYIGATQLELNRSEDAMETFKRLQNSNSLDASKAHWYLALTYLKMGKKEEVKQELQTLLDNATGYKDAEARTLIDKLD